MTKREKQLLKIAKEILDLNSKNETSLILTGSLSLLLQGVKLPRECTDIDFLCSHETIPEDRYYQPDEWYSPILPKGFIVSYEGKRSQPDAIKYYNPELDIKIDMLPEYSDCKYVGDIRCSDTYETLEAKYDYFKNDTDKDSKQKHFEDITYILKKNKKHFEYWNYTYKEWLETYSDYIKLNEVNNPQLKQGASVGHIKIMKKIMIIMLVTCFMLACSKNKEVPSKIQYRLIELTYTSTNSLNFILGYDGIIKIDTSYYSAEFSTDTVLLDIDRKLFKITEK